MTLRQTTWTSFSFFALGLLLVATLQSRAVGIIYVYNSFGPGNTYDTTTGWGVVGASTSYGYRGQAESFVPDISGNLSVIQLAMFRSGGSGRSNFYLAADDGAGAPGTIMESFANVLSPNGVLALSSTAHSLLQAGDKYWICAEPADSTTASGWFYNNQGYTAPFAYERSPWSWTPFSNPTGVPNGVFSVSVIPVPEPSSVGLMLIGFGFLLRRRSR